MNQRTVQSHGVNIVVIHSDVPVIVDTQSALDLIATLSYAEDCERVVLNKEAIVEDFFKLSTGIAGEILQKFVTYSRKIAIIGDFSGYTSKPLHDFIYECNQGNAVFFMPDEQSAVEKLATV